MLGMGGVQFTFFQLQLDGRKVEIEKEIKRQVRHENGGKLSKDKI